MKDDVRLIGRKMWQLDDHCFCGTGSNPRDDVQSPLDSQEGEVPQFCLISGKHALLLLELS